MEANNDLYVLQIAILVGGSEHEWIMTFHRLGISSSQLTNSYMSEG